MNEERRVTSNVSVENAKLIFKNFQGKGTDFNAEGNRNFGLLLPDDLAEEMARDGWRIKRLRPREDDPEQYMQPWIQVKVKFNPYPPIVMLINSKGKLRLTEETIGQLDWTQIQSCDVIIRPYNYPAVKGRPAGVSAYLKALYVTILEDSFSEKYRDLPDLGEVEEKYEED